jgi:Tfp pilus assembly protein PilV
MLELKQTIGIAVRGDTLIEVAIALAILSLVLTGSAVVATSAFRLGQTARERTTVVEAAQEQMEALHNFRDNHSWDEFRTGNNCGAPGGFCGIEQAISSSNCASVAAKKCFYMRKWPVAAPVGWVPVAGTLSNGSPDPNSTNLSVPTSIAEITLSDNSWTLPATRNCGYDFELHYSFTPLGGTLPAVNAIKTRLVNLKYTPSPGGCPS